MNIRLVIIADHGYLELLDGDNFMNKRVNFYILNKKFVIITINNKQVILKPLKLYNRLLIVSQRKLTIAESLAYELTILPTILVCSIVISV